MGKRYFVTAIHTDSGKTLVSAILTQALGADYWKPIQAGLPADTDAVKALVSDPNVTYHPEAYRLQTPASPHAAANIDGVTIKLHEVSAPKTERPLVIEGAGGILVPLNDHDVVLDLAEHLEAEVILVSNLYLGSINHTLLTAKELQRRKVPVAGIIFNGESNPESERIILHHTGYRQLLHVKQETEVNPELVSQYANTLREALQKL